LGKMRSRPVLGVSVFGAAAPENLKKARTP
jgi:hypothetical protein